MADALAVLERDAGLGAVQRHPQHTAGGTLDLDQLVAEPGDRALDQGLKLANHCHHDVLFRKKTQPPAHALRARCNPTQQKKMGLKPISSTHRLVPRLQRQTDWRGTTASATRRTPSPARGSP